MTQETKGPNTLYGVTQYRQHDTDGKTVDTYLMQRYPEGGFGFMSDRQDVLFFYDKGHRDDFAARFGGVLLTLHKKATSVVRDKAAVKMMNAAQGSSR